MQFDFSGRASKRLLDTQTYRLVFDSDPPVRTDPRYAILSHRWSDEEIEFYELTHAQDLDTRQDPRWTKIRAACSIAQRHGIRWLWSDTCCINTSHPSEKNDAINSMFRFYEEAAICITYLPDVSYHAGDTVNADTFRRADQPNLYSEWFERGWTLQELLAPRNMEFYDRYWTLIETKRNLSQALSVITGIDASYLQGTEDFRNASVASKFSWQAKRRTTRPQDLVYSLLGIVGVNMTIRYSEGAEKAFMRLQKKLLTNSHHVDDESIFAWKAPKYGLPSIPRSDGTFGADEWGMLAPSLECFRDAGTITQGREYTKRGPSGGYRLEPWGLSFPFPPTWEPHPVLEIVAALSVFCIPCILCAMTASVRNISALKVVLNCYNIDERGQRRPVKILLRRRREDGDHDFVRQECSALRTTKRDLKARRLKSRNRDAKPIIILQPIV